MFSDPLCSLRIIGLYSALDFFSNGTMWQVAFLGQPWPNTELDSALAAEILADEDQEWHRVERHQSEQILSLYTTLPRCLHRNVRVEDFEDLVTRSFKVNMVEVNGARVFWGYNRSCNLCVLFKPLASVVLTASLEMARKALPWYPGDEIIVTITNLKDVTIFQSQVPSHSHMYQLGKEVGKVVQKEMKLTNVEVTHAKVILQKSSKQWNLHQTVKDMYELDNEEDAPKQEGDQGQATSQSQKIPVSKHRLKK